MSLEERKQLFRPTDGGYVAGVCEGVGRHLGVDPNILRIIWLVAVIFAGTGVLFYLILWWVMPRQDRVPLEPTVWRRTKNGHRPPLQRTLHDRKLFGVCGGLGRRWGIDPVFVRLGALSLFTLSAGLGVIAYLVVAAFMPGPEDLTASSHPVEL